MMRRWVVLAATAAAALVACNGGGKPGAGSGSGAGSAELTAVGSGAGPLASSITTAAAPPIPVFAFDAPAPADPIVDLGEGKAWVCATRRSGHVDCWGDAFPGGVTRLPDVADARAVRGDDHHRCIRRPQKVTCTTDDGAPADVAVDAVALFVHGRICAVATDGGVTCWDDDHGPAPIAKLRDVTALYDGDVSCALLATGKVSCDAGDDDHPRWRDVKLGKVALLALGDGGGIPGDEFVNGCAVLADGSAKCFVLGADGKHVRVGDILIDGKAPPAAVTGALRGASAIVMDDTTVTALVGGHVVVVENATRPDAVVHALPQLVDAVAITRSCGLRAQGSVVCWGDRNTGQRVTASAAVPVPVVGLAGVVSIAASDTRGWAVTRDGRAFAWGGDRSGWPVPIAAITDATAVASATSGDAACFLRKSGGVTCVDGALAQIAVGGVADAVAVRGEDGFIARLASGGAAAWDLIDAAPPSVAPTPVPAAPGAVEYAGTARFACARDNSGGVACATAACAGSACSPGAWSKLAIPPARAIAEMADSACGIVDGGSGGAGGGVTCWGYNVGGVLGHVGSDGPSGGLVNEPPAAVGGVTGAVALRAWGDAFGRGYCAEGGDGSLTCWGGHTAAAPVIAQVLPPHSLDGGDFAATDKYGCAVRQNGTAVCWGDNRAGRLGDGSAIWLDAPAAVPGLK